MTWGELRNLVAPQGRVLLFETPAMTLTNDGHFLQEGL